MKSKKTREEWKELVSDFNRSSLSMVGFCKDRDFKSSTFAYWVKIFSDKEPTPKLIKLTTDPVIQNLENIQIAVGGIKLEVPGFFSTEKISKLIAVIREVV